MRGDKNNGFLNAIAPAAAAAAAISDEFSRAGSCRGKGCWFENSLVIFVASLELSSAAGVEFVANMICGGAYVTDDASEEDPDDIVDTVDDGRAG